MEIAVADLGHGNSLAIFVGEASPLLIDCGTSDSNKIVNFINFIECTLKKSVSRDLIITHYHFDHYNLVARFPPKYFDNIYMPALPRQSPTAQAMEKFLALTIATGFEQYYLAPMILSKGQNIRCLVKGQLFRAISRDWQVLWPDYPSIDKANTRKIKTLTEKTEEIKEKLSGKQSADFEYWYGRLSGDFCEEQEKPDYCPEENIRNRDVELDPDIEASLGDVEKIFRDLANRASLVVKDEPADFLFTGDVDDTILDNYLNFGDCAYFIIEAPHHGGYYGSAFDNVSTEALIISRKEKYKPDHRFLRDLPWKILVDTAKTGNCVIQSTGKRGRHMFCSNCGTHVFAYFG